MPSRNVKTNCLVFFAYVAILFFLLVFPAISHAAAPGVLITNGTATIDSGYVEVYWYPVYQNDGVTPFDDSTGPDTVMSMWEPGGLNETDMLNWGYPPGSEFRTVAFTSTPTLTCENPGSTYADCIAQSGVELGTLWLDNDSYSLTAPGGGEPPVENPELLAATPYFADVAATGLLPKAVVPLMFVTVLLGITLRFLRTNS